jgi:transcriptional regulator with XRE-family HTH domain
MNHIGLNIKKIREKWSLSQEEFGWLINATRGMIMTYEVRGSKPRAEKIARIANLTGIKTTILIDTELQDEDIPEIPLEIQMKVEKGRMYPEFMRDQIEPEPPISDKQSVDYAGKYVSLMESRLSELEQDKKFLQRMLELNLGKASVAIEKVLKLQTAHDEVIMKSLDRLEKRPEGTLAGEADNLEMEIDQRLQNLSDTDKKVVSNK